MQKKPNRLIKEKSPYLLQHAFNPVDWHPWSEEAFKKAQKEDKPVFLSIGYSTCHWCHVMEKESFEDEEIAKLLNEAFINIKVDREERPDIDQIYMRACQLITGSGGWPLTILLTPDKKPFFTGTYFPKTNKFGRIGMLELIPQLKNAWQNRKQEILNSADSIAKALQQQIFEKDNDKPEESLLHEAFDQLKDSFDELYGGFGISPKFPSPHNLMFLMRYGIKYDIPQAIKMVEKTLTEMRKGGIFDQIGYGFARYSTDRYWLVPHFEKMLYDQAMITIAFCEISGITGNNFYRDCIVEILEYVMREMISPEGGFFSAEDADSEGVEGKFYLWTKNEIENNLSKDETDFVARVFNILPDGNINTHHDDSEERTNILYLKKSFTELAEEFRLTESEFISKLDSIRKKLFDIRQKRIHPHKDDKILTDWNGLMISAFARANQATGKKEYLDTAIRGMDFILSVLYRNGKLLHRYRDGEAALIAQLDDYAFVIQALLDLYETAFNLKYLKKAIEFVHITLEEFYDKKDGGFFFTSAANTELISRQKEVYDGAIPSGNSVMLLNLLRIGKITQNDQLLEYADKLIRCFSGTIKKSPSAFTYFLCGLDFYFGPVKEIIISEDKSSLNAEEFITVILRKFLPSKILLLQDENNRQTLGSISPFTENLKPVPGKTTVFVCENYQCNLPVTTKEELERLI